MHTSRENTGIIIGPWNVFGLVAISFGHGAHVLACTEKGPHTNANSGSMISTPFSQEIAGVYQWAEYIRFG